MPPHRGYCNTRRRWRNFVLETERFRELFKIARESVGMALEPYRCKQYIDTVPSGFVCETGWSGSVSRALKLELSGRG